jgi:hypothetical protein
MNFFSYILHYILTHTWLWVSWGIGLVFACVLIYKYVSEKIADRKYEKSLNNKSR